MLTPRENAMAIFKGEQPDGYWDFMGSMIMPLDPVRALDAAPPTGEEHPDTWGTIKVRPVGSPGAHPHVTEENKVIKDIEEWQKYLKVPSLDNLDWNQYEMDCAAVDRERYFLGFFCETGLFERSHFLMGMEDAFCNYLEYPEEMEEILDLIKDYKIKYIEMVAEHVHPDVIFYHDDWGSKQNLFLPPNIWREIIKPRQKEIADCIHGCGMIYVHHADCICQPIVSDMAEIGIDIWQGAIAQNDIVAIQKELDGKMAIIGGVDGPKVDIEGLDEEVIRSEARRAIDEYCPAGRFYPGIPNGICFIKRNNDIIQDELKRYGAQWAQEHPVA